MTAKTPQLPEGMNSLSPHLVCAGAEDAIAFYKNAFDAKELMKLQGPDGKIMHAALSICGSSIMLVDQNLQYGMRGPKIIGGTPVILHLIVDDADAWAQRAVNAGATVRMPVADQFWGDRYGTVEDPFGHVWSIASPTRAPMSETELKEAMKSAAPM